MTNWVGFLGAVIAAISVASTIVLEVRRRAESRNADRARTAAELAAILELLGTAGLDPGLDAATASARHQNQLRQLHVAVRRNTAEYARKALRHGLSGTAQAILLAEGVAFVVFANLMKLSAQHTSTTDHVVLTVVAFVFLMIGVAAVVIAVMSWSNGTDRNARARDAGVQVLSWRGQLRLPSVVRTRIKQRREIRRLRALSNPASKPQRGIINTETTPE